MRVAAPGRQVCRLEDDSAVALAPGLFSAGIDGDVEYLQRVVLEVPAYLGNAALQLQQQAPVFQQGFLLVGVAEGGRRRLAQEREGDQVFIFLRDVQFPDDPFDVGRGNAGEQSLALGFVVADHLDFHELQTVLEGVLNGEQGQFVQRERAACGAGFVHGAR